ncbi:hypothetical protein BDW69DRAFT_157253 [Aspergillus filifer]
MIIWSIATSRIFALDDALTAVRATALAIKHLKKVEAHPRVFPLDLIQRNLQRSLRSQS